MQSKEEDQRQNIVRALQGEQLYENDEGRALETLKTLYVKLLVQHLKWKRSFMPLGYIKEEDISKELRRNQIMLQGHDKFGCSVVILLTAMHAAYERDLEEIKSLFVYTFDKAASSNSNGQTKVVIIGDLKGYGLKNMDIRGYLSVLEILQNQYPEHLRKLFLVHMPLLFWTAWRIVSPFMDKVTRDKIVFVDNNFVKETLTKEIDKEFLPREYGGLANFVPILDACREKGSIDFLSFTSMGKCGEKVVFHYRGEEAGHAPSEKEEKRERQKEG
ncbi:hypothetical protein KP509_20G041100 [Ceratopteris richardii]|uniref:CRAL-TRIO domain-containing protein n=1 Tax=Ceratopteris richardii TaxID=49495 RepID=A0A8T2SGG4_CERRI|nr:hypothetical protein KP509_20G041100 [Ceratopteris richardii]